jgi:hypothetical protein
LSGFSGGVGCGKCIKVHEATVGFDALDGELHSLNADKFLVSVGTEGEDFKE